MKFLQQFKVISNEGKIEEEKIGKVKAIVDSVGDNLVIDSNDVLKALPKKGIHVINIWKESTKAAKTGKKPTTKTEPKK